MDLATIIDKNEMTNFIMGIAMIRLRDGIATDRWVKTEAI